MITLAATVSPQTAPAQVRVIISGGFSGPYEVLVPQFEKSTGIRVTTLSGASQGSGPQTIAAQLAAGADVDVVIMSRQGLDDLVAANRIAAGTAVNLARTPLGVAVRTGAPKPPVTTVEEFKSLMLSAKAVAVPGSTSGIFLAKDVFPRLGIADKVLLKAMPRGSEAAALVASGAVEVAVMPVSEILHAPGVELAGVIAQDIQLNQVFSAAIVDASRRREQASRLLAFLSSAEAGAEITRSGMEPLDRK
jgi:molybdate transport system substrate-binding protein